MTIDIAGKPAYKLKDIQQTGLDAGYQGRVSGIIYENLTTGEEYYLRTGFYKSDLEFAEIDKFHLLKYKVSGGGNNGAFTRVHMLIGMTETELFVYRFPDNNVTIQACQNLMIRAGQVQYYENLGDCRSGYLYSLGPKEYGDLIS